jgi:RNA polymerase sigma-70 factor, ECF subfamily
MAQPVSEDDIRRIYRATIDDLYRFVARRCDRDRALAEDVTQETWLRAVRTWHADGIPDRPLAWLTTVARNLLSNHYRRRSPVPLDDTIAESIASEPPDVPDARLSLVDRALSRLPIPQLRLLEAFHFRRQRVAEIAEAHGISERAVEGRLRRARQQLRHQIESDPDTEGDLS